MIIINERSLTELGLEWRRSLGDSFPEDELLALMQALFSECTRFTWPAGFSKGSKLLCVRCTFRSSGIVSRGLMTESDPWQLRVDILVTHIWGEERHQRCRLLKTRCIYFRSKTVSEKDDWLFRVQFIYFFMHNLAWSKSHFKVRVKSILNVCSEFVTPQKNVFLNAKKTPSKINKQYSLFSNAGGVSTGGAEATPTRGKLPSLSTVFV